jgi:probable F420-dependent oxidoreductase
MAAKPHVRIGDSPGERATAIAFAQELEPRGFPAAWAPSMGDNVAFALAVLDRTERLAVGTGIANIYLRHAQLMGQAASLIEELHPGRFTLGIGVSHAPMHERLGLRTGKPLADTREYVEQMRAAAGGGPFPRLVLAALRQKMTALAGEIADGAVWANGVRSHMAASLEGVPADRREGFLVANLIVTAVDEDRAAALERARFGLRGYFELPSYQRYFEEAGYRDEVAAARAAIANGDREGVTAAISERFIADACLAGTPSEVRGQAEAWADAGVELVLSPNVRDGRQAMEAALAAFD